MSGDFPTASDIDDRPNFEGHQPRDCREHRTVGPHRAWCYDCGEWCYPDPEMACANCELPALRTQLGVERERADKAEAELVREESAHDHTCKERDYAVDAADTLSYTIGDTSEIGEHSSGNDPWGNAADLAGSLVARAVAAEAAVQRARDLAVEWHNATETGSGRPSIVLRAFAAELSAALEGTR